MKKAIALFLVLILSAAALGCAAPAEEPAAEATAAPAAAEPTAEPTATPVPTKLDLIKQSGKLVVATSPDYPPYEFIDLTKTGQESYVGSDIELAKYIAEQLGVELVIEAMDFTAVQAAVTQGKVDLGISGLAYLPERAESMELSDYYGQNDDGQLLIVLKGQEATYSSAEAFTGKKVAAQNASLQFNLVTEQLPNAVLEPISNLNEAVMMVVTGKVDALAASGDNALAFTKNYDQIAIAQFQFDYAEESMVVGAPKGEVDLIAAINEIIKKANAENLYQKWMDEAAMLAESLGVEY